MTNEEMPYDLEQLTLFSKEDADKVLECLKSILKEFGVVYVSDLLDLVGLPRTYADDKYGWMFLNGVEVIQVEDRYIIKMPQPGIICKTIDLTIDLSPLI